MRTIQTLRVALVDDISIDSARRYTQGLLKGLDRIGVGNLVTLYTRKDRKIQNFRHTNVKGVWTRFMFPFQITRAAIRDRRDVVHIQFDSPTFGLITTPILLPLLLILLRISGRKTSATMHAVPVFSSRTDTKTMIDLLGARSIKLPMVMLRTVVFVTYFLVACCCLRIVVHTSVLKKWLESEYGINGNKIKVIPHGSAAHYAEYAKKDDALQRLGGKKTILFFGRVNPRKGLEVLLLAWSKLSQFYPEYVLIVAGTIYRYDFGARYFGKLKRMASELGIQDRVVFTGKVPEDQIDMLYLNSEFVVLPYLLSNSASGPLATAIGFGKPVIASAVGTFKDEIENYVNGILVKPGDELELETAIRMLLQNEGLRDSLARGAENVNTRHSWEFHARAIFSMWESM